MNLDEISLTNFIDLSDDNKLMILDWRNDDNVRKWMYNSDIILKEEHFLFIESLKSNRAKQYFLVSSKDQLIGVICFTDIDIVIKASEFGIFSNPNLKGNGTILMKTICRYAFRILNLHTIIAEVFIDNQKAINLYRNFHFQKIGENFHKNKQVICMELKNENR